jgi:ribosomal protein S18 acetylase RimI-like enzyme
MKIKLVEAQANQISELMKLVEKFYQHFDYSFDYETHSQLVKKFLANPHFGRVYLIQYQDQWIGYLALTFGFTFEYGGKDAFVDEFFVDPDYRSQGIGKYVLNEIQGMAKALELKALHLQTEKYNTRAKELYQSVGFKDKARSTLTWLVK